MLQALLVRIIIISPVSGSDFSEGDEISVWVNASTGDVSVLLNDSPYAGGSGSSIGALGSSGGLGFEGVEGTFQIISGVTSYQSGYAISGYSRCDEGDLIWYRMPIVLPAFPYMEQVTTVDSPVCGVGQACDIHFTGPLQLTHSTRLTNPNGAVTASATSSNADGSNPVKYSLSDFDYASGGQTSGTFSNLAPGEYTIHAKDQNDCTAQSTFTILFKPDYGEHYRFTWTPLDTGKNIVRQSRIRIYEREYVGDVVELSRAGTVPFRLNKPMVDQHDKFAPIHPTNAEINLIAETNFEFFNLITQDDTKFRVDYETDTGDGFAVRWSGFILPSVGNEPYVAPPYPVQFLAADILKILETTPFTDNDGNILFGEMKLIKIISFILQKTGLTLNIRSGINIFETNHDTTSADDPLDQTYVDVSCYLDEDAEPFNCAQVLEFILRPFGARIYLEDGQWCLEEIDRAKDGYSYRVFDAAGDYVSNGSIDPILDIKKPEDGSGVVMTLSDQVQSTIPAYRQINLKLQLNYVGTLRAGFERINLLNPNTEEFNTATGVFTSEEGFREWTLRMDGMSGVSFGRAELLDRDALSEQRLRAVLFQNGIPDPRIVSDDNKSSCGVFHYDPESWTGNLRDAYIESTAKPFEYGPGDKLLFRFSFRSVSPSQYPFGVIRFAIKIGSNWLQQDDTWSASEAILRAYPKLSGDFQTLELETRTPSTRESVESTIQVRIYAYFHRFFDYGLPAQEGGTPTDGTSEFITAPTATVDTDLRVDVCSVSGTRGRKFFYELRRLNEEELEDFAISVPDKVPPTDSNTETNPVYWQLLAAVDDGHTTDTKFYIENIALDTLISGQEPPRELTLSALINRNLKEDNERTLFHFDLPEIRNGRTMYNNYFRLSDGTPTKTWARSGISEAQTLQSILLSIIASNYAAPTFSLRGTFLYQYGILKLSDYLRLTKPGSDLSITNTTFDSDLSGWTQTGTGTSFTWTSDNDGSAEVELTGAVHSKKLVQAVDHIGGFVVINASIHAIPGEGNDREDAVVCVLYRGASLVHTERLRTIQAPTSEQDINITDWKIMVPSSITQVGFYLHNVTGTGTCKYQITEFEAEGNDVQEVYQIADYSYDDFSHSATLELLQLSKALISLQGTDVGGDPQGGGEPNNPGSGFNRAYSDGYGSGFA